LENQISNALERLETLHPKLIDLELGRTLALLGKLDNPHKKSPPTIHIAGTNGKGSLLAFLRAVLLETGARVHAYTSPHLIRFNERIELAGMPISDPALADLLDEVETVNAGDPITIFEIITCAAFLAFSRTPAEWLLLETGLGGQFDATNVLDAPELTAITPVSLDHKEFLGDDLVEIAREKAGIIKSGRPVVSGLQDDSVMAVIERVAVQVGAPVWLRGRDWHVDSVETEPRYRSATLEVNLAGLSLAGPHQIDNAATAVAVIDHLGTATHDEIAAGLTKAIWPGRLQRLGKSLFHDLVPDDWEIWLDGGHNAAAGSALGRVAQNWHADERPLLLLCAMMANKDAAGFLRPIAPFVTDFEAVPLPREAAGVSARDLAAAARKMHICAGASESIDEGLSALAARHSGPARVLICGSLYLAGAILGGQSDACGQ
jgi:dihydrofolate synthase/folylpolyglutamate synthase